jgi:putative ABC transport system permease protein
MELRETLTVAIDALRANKLRAVLTSIGVIIGSASIVLVVTIALTSRKYVISQIEAVGSNLVWVELVKTPDKVQPLSYDLTISDLRAVKESIPGVVTVAGISDMPMTVVVEGKEKPVALIGVTEGYQQIRHLVILRGRYFDLADMEARSKVCLVTRELAQKVYGVENPIGRLLRMGELTFTVIGLFHERVATYGLSEMQEDSVLIPFELIKYTRVATS